MNGFRIPLIKSPFFDEAETRRKLADFILRTPLFSMGKECAQYERAFAAKQGRKHAVFMNSGSSANLALIQALLNEGIVEKGARVGISALTWSTNVMPLIQLGLVPVAVDCEKETLNVSARTLEPHLGDIRAFFATNVLGFCGDMDKIRTMCGERGVTFLEDNCEALGSEAYGTRLGNFGLASTFSFFLGHHLSTIEGGMVCTDDERLYHMLLMVRSHGWGRHLPEEKHQALRDMHHVDEFYALYTFYEPGFNVRPTEVNGFLGNLALEHWDDVIRIREGNFRKLHEATLRNEDLIPLAVGHMGTVSSFAMPILCKDETATKEYKDTFRANGVEVRPIISGDITNQPFYRKYAEGDAVCPNARFVHRNGFYFGNNTDMTEEEIAFLASLL